MDDEFELRPDPVTNDAHTLWCMIESVRSDLFRAVRTIDAIRLLRNNGCALANRDHDFVHWEEIRRNIWAERERLPDHETVSAGDMIDYDCVAEPEEAEPLS